MKKLHIFISCLIFSVGCLFDGSGLGDNPTISATANPNESSSSTSTGTTTENLTSGIIKDAMTSTSTTTGGTTEEIVETVTSATEGVISTSSTSGSSSGEFESSSGSGSSSTGNEPVELCGNCRLDLEEECDVCNYEVMQTQSYCVSPEDPEFQKCSIGFYKLLGLVMKFGPLQGMQTPQYDQEEADLLCKIMLHSQSAKSSDFNIGMSYSPVYSFISPVDIQNKGILLKSAKEYYPNGSLYFFEFDDLPGNNQFEQVFYIFKCAV